MLNEKADPEAEKAWEVPCLTSLFLAALAGVVLAEAEDLEAVAEASVVVVALAAALEAAALAVAVPEEAGNFSEW